jgi:uncharacterized membrane protein YeaQ/YmgE (transglycosylase-associated protein family)
MVSCFGIRFGNRRLIRLERLKGPPTASPILSAARSKQALTKAGIRTKVDRHRLHELVDARTNPHSAQQPEPALFMLHIIWYIIIGFIAGFIAKVILHGPHMGFLETTLLGIVGSIVGGLIARLFSKPAQDAPFHPAGLILSIIGAIIVLFIVGRL